MGEGNPGNHTDPTTLGEKLTIVSTLHLMLLHDKQKEIASSSARFKTIRAGRKGGKSALEVETIAFKATASVSRFQLNKTTFATGRRLAGLYSPNQQLLQMKVPNEDAEMTTIYVGGWQNRENYRGLTDVIHNTFDETDTLKTCLHRLDKDIPLRAWGTRVW